MDFIVRTLWIGYHRGTVVYYFIAKNSRIACSAWTAQPYRGV